ncbi:MAG: LPS export ABC transporter periplasmic protein LptC [Bacteroidetes bacterium]|nr:LPS export ABC transporter periplasmic protein LptC [Bacteroidota bacterium]
MLHTKHFLFFASVLLLMSAACVNDPAKVNSITKKENLPLLTEHNVDAIYSDSAKIKFHITAPELNEFEGPSPYEEMPKGIKVEFYNDSGKIDGYLSSNYAVYKKTEQIMEAKGKVVFVNTKGEKLETEHLIWEQAKKRIHTDAYVTITTGSQIIYGDGLESDELFEDYTITHPRGIIALPDVDKK